jgi:hypothetical protein
MARGAGAPERIRGMPGRSNAPLFQVVAINAWAEPGGWTWNDQNKLFQFRSNANNIKRAFVTRLRRFLADGVVTISGMREHIDIGRGWYYLSDDGCVVELRSRKDHEPLYGCYLIEEA